MNKKIIMSIAIIVLFTICLTGCNKKSKKDDNSEYWGVEITDQQAEIPKEAMEAYKRAAKKYEEGSYDVIALLGKQVVAGTNYMFLCKESENAQTSYMPYRTVIVYNDLKDESKITSVNEFYAEQYANQNIEDKSTAKTGGWEVDFPDKPVALPTPMNTIYNNATKDLKGVKYSPIANLANEKVKSGTNHAVVCYGNKDNKNGIYVLTISEIENEEPKVKTSAYVDLSEYNS